MLVSPTTQHIMRVNAFEIGGYSFDVQTTSATILVRRYWKDGTAEPVYVDTRQVDVTPEETIQRMTVVINGASMSDELRPWAEAKARAAGLIPADAVYVVT